jgi:predicted nucleic acid-binding protein
MENRNVILDSNLFIALYSPDDTLHNQAVLMMEGLKNICIIVPYCVIQEVATVLTYKQGKKKADIF